MRRMISQELAEYLANMKNGAVAEWVAQMKEQIPSGKAPCLWETDHDFDDIPSTLLKQVKIGDLIYSSSEKTTAIVDGADEESIFIKLTTNAYVIIFNYDLIDDEYVFGIDERSINITSGTDHFIQFTHSFNELDNTLKQIVEDAIEDEATDGVACTEAQWGAIKELLNKSLYLNYNGYSLIKVLTDGIANYKFGVHTNNDMIASQIEIYYNNSTQLLYCVAKEV